MPRQAADPVLLTLDDNAKTGANAASTGARFEQYTRHLLTRVPKAHDQFDESFIKELLAVHPALLPVKFLRADAEDLLCIGREVPLPSGNAIDNLYLSTSGYPVVVEAKLWRNAEARRYVFGQVVEYTRELATLDFAWLETTWRDFVKSEKCFLAEKKRGLSLAAAIADLAGDEIAEDDLTDTVNAALHVGDIISIIVGDGITTQLQQLVDYLCENSSHLRYSIGLVALRCYNMPGQKGLLVVPEIVQEVEPVQRAYIRIEYATGLQEQLRVESKSMVSPTGPGVSKQALTEEVFLAALKGAIGDDNTKAIRTLYTDLRQELGLETTFATASLMLKFPDPAEEARSASLLGFGKDGGVFNARYLPTRLANMKMDQTTAAHIASNFWQALHRINKRFALDGIPNTETQQYVPFQELTDKDRGDLRAAIRQAVAEIRNGLKGAE